MEISDPVRGIYLSCINVSSFRLVIDTRHETVRFVDSDRNPSWRLNDQNANRRRSTRVSLLNTVDEGKNNETEEENNQIRKKKGKLTFRFDCTEMGTNSFWLRDSVISAKPVTSKFKNISPPIFWKSSAKCLQTKAQSTIPVHGDHSAFSPCAMYAYVLSRERGREKNGVLLLTLRQY